MADSWLAGLRRGDGEQLEVTLIWLAGWLAVRQVIEASKISMGYDMSDVDMINVQARRPPLLPPPRARHPPSLFSSHPPIAARALPSPRSCSALLRVTAAGWGFALLELSAVA